MVEWSSESDWDANQDDPGFVHDGIADHPGTGTAAAGYWIGQTSDGNPPDQSALQTNGLVGWWPLHRTAGAAVDLGSGGNNGTVNDTPARGVAGRAGLQAYSFDGVDDSVDTGNTFSSVISANNPFSISFWAYNLSGTGQLIFNRYDTTVTNDATSYVGFLDTDEVRWFARSDGGTFQLDLRSTFSVTEGWHHVAGVWDGTNQASLYVDGNLDNTGTYDGAWNEDVITVKFLEHNTGGGFIYSEGSLTDVRLYDRALSDSEVSTLHDWGAGDYTSPELHDGTDSGAVSRWKFEGDVTDSWGSNDGTDNTSAGFTSNAIRGQGKSFDGTDDEVTTGYRFTDDAAFTISAWANATSESDFHVVAFTPNNSNGIVLQKDNSDKFRFYVENADTVESEMISDKDISGNWHHLAVTWDGSTASQYLNGATINTSAQSSITHDGDLRFGATPSGAYYLGDIDDVRVYNRALTPSEVHDLYRWGTRGRDLRKETVIA